MHNCIFYHTNLSFTPLTEDSVTNAGRFDPFYVDHCMCYIILSFMLTCGTKLNSSQEILMQSYMHGTHRRSLTATILQLEYYLNIKLISVLGFLVLNFKNLVSIL